MKYLLMYILLSLVLVLPANSQLLRSDSLEMELARFVDASRYNKYAVSLLNELAAEYAGKNPSEAMRYAEEAIAAALRIDDKEGECKGLLNRGLIRLRTNDQIQALNDMERALSLARSNNLQRLTVDVLEQQARFYIRVGNLQLAMDLLNESLALRVAKGINNGLYGTYSKLASINKQLGNYDEALALYEKAHAIVKATNNTRSGQSETEILTKLAGLSAQQKDWESAIRYSTGALNRFRNSADGIAVLELHSDLGLYYWRLYTIEEAQKHCSLAVQLGTSIGTDYATLLKELNLGRLHELEQNWADAFTHYTRAYQQMPDIHVPEIRSGAAVGIGRLLIKSGRSHRAKNVIDAIKTSYTPIQYQLYSEDIALIETLVAYETDTYMDALTAFAGYSAVQDSLHRSKRIQKLNELEMDYQLQLKERENILLLKDKKLKEVELLRRANELGILTRDKKLQALKLSEHEATVQLHKRIARETKKELALLEKARRVQELELERERMLSTAWAAGGVVFGIIALFIGYLYRQKKRAASEQRQKARELSEANEQILVHQQEVEQKSVELRLALDQLQHRNEALEVLNKEKSEFLAIAAHDLKNPIGLIHGLADLILESELDEELVVDSMGNILHATDRMIVLISNLLDIDKIESGMMEIARKPVDVQGVLEQAVQLNYQKAYAKGIALSNESMLCGIHGNGDPDSLQQVLDNLVSNAIKFSHPGSCVSVWVSEETEWLDIHVRDDGPGISKEDQQLLFQKFARLTPQPTGGEVSTGLGLYIVSRLVKAMGASISCESEVGKGSEFIVRLPRVADEVTEPFILTFN